MSGAIVAKALNSTLGTKKFKGLDEIYVENLRIVADTEQIYQIFPGSAKYMGNPSSEGVTVATLSLPYNGSIFLNCKLYASNADYYTTLKVYKNDELYTEISERRNEATDPDTYEYDLWIPLHGTTTDKFSFVLSDDLGVGAGTVTSGITFYSIGGAVYLGKNADFEMI